MYAGAVSYTHLDVYKRQTFQNGEPLTADDVVFSYELAMKNSKYGYVTSMIDKIEAKDEKTVVMTLKYPYAAIGHTFFTIKVISEKEYNEITDAGETFGTKPHKAGTGPYYVTEYDVSAGVKLAAYEDYWQGAPDIKKVEYRVITDDAAAVIAFEKDVYKRQGFAVQISGGLVGKNDERIVHQRAGYRSALFFTAGNFCRIFVHNLIDSEQAAEFFCFCFHLSNGFLCNNLGHTDIF